MIISVHKYGTHTDLIWLIDLHSKCRSNLVGLSILPVFFSNLHIVVVSLRKTVSYPQLNEGTEGSDQNRDSNDKK